MKYKLHLEDEKKKKALSDSDKQMLSFFTWYRPQSETNRKGSYHDE